MAKCERCKMDADKGLIWCPYCGAKTRSHESTYDKGLEKQQNNIIVSRKKIKERE